MNEWELEVEEIYSTKEKLGGPKTGRASVLPEANKMAAMIRRGRTCEELAERYDVSTRTIYNRLLNAGWNSVTGERNGRIRANVVPLNARGDGAGTSVHHVGGGDNPGVVPTAPVKHRPRNRPTGFAWPAPQPATAPKPTRSVAQRTARQLSDIYDPSRPGRRSKLTPRQRDEIAEAYIDGASSADLGKQYGIHQSRIIAALRTKGVPIRNHREATTLRHARRRTPPEEAA